MSHTPPVPEGNTSPYPIAEPPHVSHDRPPAVTSPATSSVQPSAPIVAFGIAAILGAAALALFLSGSTRGA